MIFQPIISIHRSSLANFSNFMAKEKMAKKEKKKKRDDGERKMMKKKKEQTEEKEKDNNEETAVKSIADLFSSSSTDPTLAALFDPNVRFIIKTGNANIRLNLPNHEKEFLQRKSLYLKISFPKILLGLQNLWKKPSKPPPLRCRTRNENEKIKSKIKLTTSKIAT